MKKRFFAFAAVLLAAVSAFGFAACDRTADPPPVTSDEQTPELPDHSGEDSPELPDHSGEDSPDLSDDGNVLVVYFSWSSAGNTERMADYIAEQLRATVWEITPVTPYPAEYAPTTDVALEEKENNARPAIADPLTQEQIDEYDAVFVGFPIWWHTAPMIIGTFLESYAWRSETDIYPFFQGASNNNNGYYTETMAFINDCAKGATVHNGLYASHTNTAAIDAYLRTNGFIN